MEGFRVMFQRPIVGIAEIAWRWSFGFAVAFLVAISFLEFLDTLPVSNAEILLFRSRQPFLIAQAISHILRGTALRVVLAGVALSMAAALAWVVLGTFGRAATLNAVVYRVRSARASGWVELPRTRLRTLFGLNLLRVGTIFAATIGCVGAMLLARTASSGESPSPGAAVAIFTLVLMLVVTASLMLNWFLSLASVFACSSRTDTFTSLERAVGVCRDRFGAVLAASSWFGLAHFIAFFVASSAVGVPLGFAGLLPSGVVIGGVLLVTLLYFAIVDFLYIGRLAAYVTIVEMPEMPESVDLPPAPPQGPSRVDQDELILSDVPMVSPTPVLG